MERRRAYASIASVVMLLAYQGCDALPTSPSGASTQQTYALAGVVADTAFRPLGSARVEVIGGPRAGTIATTDDTGHYSLSGTFSGDTSLMASKQGYRSQTYIVPPSSFRRSEGEAQAWAAFHLELLDPAADITGAYTMTIAADGACPNLPDEARVRTYSATVVSGNRPGLFVASLSDARFFRDLNTFSIGTAGDFAGFPSLIIMEALGGTTHVLIDGFAEGSVGPTGISASFEGWVVSCPAEPTLIDQGTYWCLDAARSECSSGSHRLALVRR